MLDPKQTAESWYTVGEIHTWLNRQRSWFEDTSRVVPPNVSSREFSEWLTKELQLAMEKGISMAQNNLQSHGGKAG